MTSFAELTKTSVANNTIAVQLSDRLTRYVQLIVTVRDDVHVLDQQMLSSSNFGLQ